MFRLTIEVPSFEDDPKSELAWTIRHVAARVKAGETREPVFDFHGNLVGSWRMDESADNLSRRDRHMFSLTIKTDNAAFADPGPSGELVRILHAVASHISAGRMSGKVRDINGNTVGEFAYEEAQS